MPRLGSLIAAACLAPLLAACSSTPEPMPSNPAPSSPISIPTGLTPAPTDVPEQHDDGSIGTPMPGSTLTLDEASRDSAIERGQTVMSLFARRAVDATQWQADLAPYLTPQAAQAYLDWLPRALFPLLDTDLPVGVLTAGLGGPLFLFLLWRERERLS